MSLDISFPAFHYGKTYLGTLIISKNKKANGVKLSIKSSEVVTFKVIFSDDREKDLEVPISSLGTYAVRINYDALRDALAKWSRSHSSENSEGKNRSGFDIYPILFTFNKDYGTVGIGDVNVAVLSGVTTCVEGECLKERSEAENTYLLIIRSRSKVKTGARWRPITTCSDKREHGNEEKGGNCRLFSFIIIDKYIKDRLTGIVEDQKDQERISYEVDIETPGGNVHSDSVELSISSLKYVKAFLRSFPLIRLERLCPSDSNNTLELCRGDLEHVHVGSQITVRCEKYTHDCLVWLNGWRPHYINFISPVIISYPMEMPESPYEVVSKSSDRWETKSFVITLPQDKVLNTGVVKFSIKDFTWDKAVKLVDWLWVKRPDALFKSLLNEEVILAIEQFIKEIRDEDYQSCSYKPIGLFTKTTLYGKKIIIYSPLVEMITTLYDSINAKVSNDNHGSRSDYTISDVVAQLMDKLLSSRSGCDYVKRLLQDHEDEVKKILSIFVLAYGLHGVSHLLMKALTALTGITDYTEFIRVEVDTHWGQDIVKKALKSSGFQENVYHENLFEIIPGENFDLNVYVISREPYSYAIYRDRLIDKSSNQLKLDDVKTRLKKLISYEISHESKDACEVRWQLERDLLSPYRSILLNPSNQNVLSQVDKIVEDYLKNHFKPPRSLFRYLYAVHIRKKILNRFQQGNNADDVKEMIDTNIQYIWPYHLPRCIDGCYGCVLMEGSSSSRTCDLSPLVQELKVSKWSALCLLKYAGLIDEPWVDCKLT
jgi:hypothetical protein